MSAFDPLTVFPHKELTKFPDGRPTHSTVILFIKENYANLMSSHSRRGGGNTGMLGSTMPANEFANLPGTAPWIDPVHPGAAPNHAAGATAAQITKPTANTKPTVKNLTTTMQSSMPPSNS